MSCKLKKSGEQNCRRIRWSSVWMYCGYSEAVNIAKTYRVAPLRPKHLYYSEYTQ